MPRAHRLSAPVCDGVWSSSSFRWAGVDRGAAGQPPRGSCRAGPACRRPAARYLESLDRLPSPTSPSPAPNRSPANYSTWSLSTGVRTCLVDDLSGVRLALWTTPVTSGDTNSPLPERVTRAGKPQRGPDDWTRQASGPTLRAAGQRLIIRNQEPDATRKPACPVQAKVAPSRSRWRTIWWRPGFSWRVAVELVRGGPGASSSETAYAVPDRLASRAPDCIIA